ncbi:alpha/beta fold hydrolase [Niveispirillum sp. SYP-B3756]|uniref:alpha/beta fold hydrolase n=1 Tax=Niveispirillum sp. SYP-B3756 TaxID=2662178 RepID=UPI0012915B74|nr:alpha/beta fold hydrolase [Niveispirillum sp. SYP-B3756]
MTQSPLNQRPVATRHFIHIDGRTVHYRRWGQGPVVLALHGSPQSSRTMTALGEGMAARGFCVIAPDTPGNGLSSPLADDCPETDAYALALKQFVDVLGLERFGLYGFHTGATTACAFAALYPERVTGVLFDGLPCWTADERAHFLADYLPPLRPHWDGSHMAWVWARMEEQLIFFPWHLPSPAARMDYDLPQPPHLHENALEMLEAGDAYRKPYRAAFVFDPARWLPRLRCEHLILVTAKDPLCPHLGRPGLKGANSNILPDSPALQQAAMGWLAARPGSIAPSLVENTDAFGIGRGQVQGVTGPIGWLGRRRGTGRPLVLLHDAGGNALDMRPALRLIDGPVLALDLPGHGLSSRAQPLTAVTNIAAELTAALCGLGLERPRVAGHGFGAVLAAQLAASGVASDSIALGMPAPAMDPVLGAPSLAPEWDGAHLLRAFRIARRERLFAPWYDGRQSQAILPQPSLDLPGIQARALSLLRAGTHWPAALQAHAAMDVAGLLEGLGSQHRLLAEGRGPAADWAHLLHA